ncbi:hypothetical protein [Clostridium tagluense]|uniref:Uncharacterized protein n=1 Tax=Clostridium tagluense TaxID=360422 RepID=A0A401UQ18_9CLOT|nr:hypothetical protein [Clostridium tagluense]GCD11629.1 hypothetical protein Ctaglu_32520 [Clostridium tagluense]
MINNYFDYCEKNWNVWLNKQDIQEQMFEKYFDLRYCAEPYLRFIKDNNEKLNSIYFLTTNPGGGFEQQDIEYILQNKSIIKNDLPYHDNAKNLADYYKENLIGTSKHRITHMDYLAQKCGYDNFIQIESIPYHSKKLPGKNRLTKLIKSSNNSISEYINITKEYLADKNVIAIQAGKPKNIKELNDWYKLQCEIIGLEIGKSEYISINDRDTIGMYIQKENNTIKALCLRAGANDLPGPNGCDIIAKKYNTLK